MGGGTDALPMMLGMGGAGGPAGAGVPPIPERNSLFTGGVGESARGAQMIKDNPGLIAQAMSTPRGQPPITPSAPVSGEGPGTSMVPPRRVVDKATAFDTQPDTRTPSVFGEDVTGQNWKPGKTAPMARPVQAATASAVPAPEEAAPSTPSVPPAAPFAEQQFDTAAPGPAGTGVWDTIKGGLKTAQGKLKGLPTNPMGQVGLSLLASGYDGSNPYKLIQSSLGGIQPHELALRSADIASAAANRADRTAKADDESNAMQRAIWAQMLMKQGGAQSGQSPASRQAEGQARVIR